MADTNGATGTRPAAAATATATPAKTTQKKQKKAKSKSGKKKQQQQPKKQQLTGQALHDALVAAVEHVFAPEVLANDALLVSQQLNWMLLCVPRSRMHGGHTPICLCLRACLRTCV